MTEPKTYQPHWGEDKHKSKRKRHSNEQTQKKKYFRVQDRQAFYGAILVVFVIIAYLFYTLGGWIKREIQSMPFDNPDEEIQVDVLRINKVEEEKALLLSDSLAQAYNLDSIKRKVQIETVPVYRPPRKENKWYITKKEWKDIWQNIKIRRFEKQQDEQREKE